MKRNGEKEENKFSKEFNSKDKGNKFKSNFRGFDNGDPSTNLPPVAVYYGIPYATPPVGTNRYVIKSY